MLYQFEYKEIKNCYGCPLLYHDDVMGPVGCLIHEDDRDPQFFDETKPEWCPLKELSGLQDPKVEFYKKYPDMFISDYFGIELYPYQKMILRNIIKLNRHK